MLALFKAHQKEIIALSDRLVEKEMIYAEEIRSLTGIL